MVFVKIVFFSVLIIASAKAGVVCYSDGEISQLFYEDSEERIELVDFNYTPPSYIDPTYSCTGHINRISNKLSFSSISLLVGANKWRMGRMVGGAKNRFYSECLNRPSCQIRWPYIMSTPHLFDKWIKKKFKSKSSCHVPVNVDLLSKEIKFSDVAPLSPSKTIWWKMPESDIVSQTLKIAKEKDYKRIIIAGMTASFHSLEELKEIAASKNIKIEVYLDHQLNSMKEGFIPIAEKLRPEIQFNLVPRTPSRPYSFHFKGVLFLDSANSNPDQLIWISPNWFKVQDHTVLHDIGFITTEKNSVLNILYELSKYKKRLCQEEVKWSRCLIEERNHGKRLRKREMALVQAACENLSEKKIDFQRSVISFESTDVLSELRSWMLAAKEKIEIHTHVFKEGVFLDLLEEMRFKKIPIRLRIGMDVSVQLKKKIINLGIELLVENREKVETHSKFIIRDGGEAFITSANFTDTGLKNPTEIGFFTKDPKAIKLMSSLLE
ncbi:MAG: phospholipase D-like domain-containing protein [Bacteriovoracaceae bacterium]